MTPEDILNEAVQTGKGFRDAEDTERACRWAVDEIARLRAEADRYRAALEAIADGCAREPGDPFLPPRARHDCRDLYPSKPYAWCQGCIAAHALASNHIRLSEEDR